MCDKPHQKVSNLKAWKQLQSRARHFWQLHNVCRSLNLFVRYENGTFWNGWVLMKTCQEYLSLYLDGSTVKKHFRNNALGKGDVQWTRLVSRSTQEQNTATSFQLYSVDFFLMWADIMTKSLSHFWHVHILIFNFRSTSKILESASDNSHLMQANVHLPKNSL